MKCCSLSSCGAECQVLLCCAGKSLHLMKCCSLSFCGAECQVLLCCADKSLHLMKCCSLSFCGAECQVLLCCAGRGEAWLHRGTLDTAGAKLRWQGGRITKGKLGVHPLVCLTSNLCPPLSLSDLELQRVSWVSTLWSVWPGITKGKLGVHPLVCLTWNYKG